MSAENKHFNSALVRAKRAITGDVIPHRSLKLVDSQTTGSLESGKFQQRDVLIGARVVEVRIRTKTASAEQNPRIRDHERIERLSDGVRSVIEGWSSSAKTPASRISATGEELNENTQWSGCRCRSRDCSHRQNFRQRLASLGINWNG